MYDVILIKYAEITLKGDNKNFFEKKLAENIKRLLKKNKIKYEKIVRFRTHMIIHTKEKEEKIRPVIEKIFGIANFSFAYTCEKDIEKINKFVLSKTSFMKKSKTFKVDASRQNKSFKHNSMEIGRIVGETIYNKYKIKGDMKNPETTVYIDIADNAYIYFEKIQGLGNLPVGCAGKVISLLSGGIDSPVASLLAMKRGCYVTYVHFYNNEKDIQKIIKLVKILNNYQLSCKLYLVPFSIFQISAANVFPNYEMILFRRYMLKIAQKIAEIEYAKAVVLGDNLGQVASQTIDNLAALEYENTKMPILRPLITFSKQEIIDLAKKVGTYDISIQPQKDCCSIVSRTPSTKANVEKVLEQEKQMDIDKLVEKTMKKLESRII